MPQSSLQLHGTLDDFVQLVVAWVEREPVRIAAQKHTSDWFLVSSGQELAALGEPTSGITRILLSEREISDVDDSDFHDLFVIHVGNRTEEGLRESSMGVVTDDSHSLQLWQRLIRMAQEVGHAGASVVDPHTGARNHLPSHRHLQGAHDLAEQGVPMLAIAGWNLYEFDDMA